MALADHNLSTFSTDELVAIKAAALQGQPSQTLVDELARRSGIAFIQATDSTEVTLQKAFAAIRQVEQRYQSKFNRHHYSIEMALVCHSTTVTANCIHKELPKLLASRANCLIVVRVYLPNPLPRLTEGVQTQLSICDCSLSWSKS